MRGTSRAIRRELGVWAGIMAEKPGDVHECARAGPRRRAERAELAHDAKREKRDARGNGSTTGDPGPRDRERGSAWAKETRADRLVPPGCNTQFVIC